MHGTSILTYFLSGDQLYENQLLSGSGDANTQKPFENRHADFNLNLSGLLALTTNQIRVVPLEKVDSPFSSPLTVWAPSTPDAMPEAKRIRTQKFHCSNRIVHTARQATGDTTSRAQMGPNPFLRVTRRVLLPVWMGPQYCY